MTTFFCWLVMRIWCYIQTITTISPSWFFLILFLSIWQYVREFSFSRKCSKIHFILPLVNFVHSFSRIFNRYYIVQNQYDLCKSLSNEYYHGVNSLTFKLVSKDKLFVSSMIVIWCTSIGLDWSDVPICVFAFQCVFCKYFLCGLPYL